MSLKKLTWNKFRAAHKGLDLSTAQLSENWGLYKDGQYEMPTEIPSEPVMKQEKQPKVEVPAQENLIAEYRKLSNRLYRFGKSMSDADKKKLTDRIAEIANATSPNRYVCQPTDSWKLWLGPTQKCVLVNETRRVAFRISRSWWQHNYQGARYVDYETVAAQDTLDRLEFDYIRRKCFVEREPLPSVEIKLPKTARETQLAGPRTLNQ